MATYAEIQTRINRLVIDLPAAVTAEVPTLVNEAIRSLERKHNFWIMEAETSRFTTLINTHTLTTGTVPANWKEIRGLPYEVQFDGNTRRLDYAASREAVLSRFDLEGTIDKGRPEVILRGEPTDEDGASVFTVFPLSDGLSKWTGAPAGEYRIIIPYWRFLTKLSADGDDNWFTVNAEEYIVEKATSRAFILDWDEARAAVHAQLATEHLADVLKADKTQRLRGATVLVPHKNADDSQLRRA